MPVVTTSLDDSRTSIYHDGSYLASHADWHANDSPWKAGQILKMIRRHNLPTARTCEIGCGAGEILVQLAQDLPESRFEGYDISPDLAPFWQPRKSERIEFHEADLLQVDQATGYDLMLVIDLIEHVENYFALLRGLRPRTGHMILHIPLDMNALGVARGWPLRRARSNAGHIHYFTQETALASLQEVGFEVVDWFHTSGVLDRGLDRTPRAIPLRLVRQAARAMHEGMAARLLGGFSLMVLVRPERT